ncbi:MAG: efflux RND transporter permease subunit, partial [Myxococcales bacterium]|nr:efflux RND transporter permease subunit [Myxococcales bacterium]
EGVTLTEGSALAYDALKVLKLPTGYLLYDGGANEQLAKSNRLARTLLGLALFLVFVVMAVQYESIRNPLVIMTSVPFCTIGVALGLEAYTMPISMPVWLGLILLAGIVVNNAIVLVDYARQLQLRGHPVDEALVIAGQTRLRPILMTTLTTVLGLLPMAFGGGDGAELRRPIALTLIAGLVFSTGLTLVVIPVLYRWLVGEPKQKGRLAEEG